MVLLDPPRIAHYLRKVKIEVAIVFLRLTEPFSFVNACRIKPNRIGRHD